MKTKLIILVVLGSIFKMNAQVIAKSSIDAGGGTAIADNIEMLFTIGETNSQELSVGEIKVSEGFISGNILEFVLPTEDFKDVAFEISLYPNPAVEYFQIKGLKEKTNLVIYDTTGKEVLREANYQSGKIDINRLASGVYMVRIFNKNLNDVKRVVKN